MPEVIDNKTFDESLYETCTLYVPSGSLEVYRHHYIFGKFKHIEIDPSLSE